MMFTHSGITGPLVLSASAHIGDALKKQGELPAFIDLKTGPLRKNSLTRGSSENLRPEKTNSLKM